MSPDKNQNPEAEKKKPNITESVDDLISKKKSEKASEGTSAVQQSAEGVQTEITEVMAGVEKPKERVSERKGESGEQGDIKGGGGAVSDDQAMGSHVQLAVLPNEEIMVKKIRAVINAQIKTEMKKAKKLKGKLASGGAQEYNATISRIRKLKEALASLFTATYEFVKNIYLKYFTPEGKKREMDEIQQN